MIETYKIIHGIYDRLVSPDLHVLDVTATRGNKYKLKKIRCETSIRV